jgi:AAA family ATP:ADP antiporter
VAFVARALRVDRGEGRITAYTVAVMFASMAGSAIGESGIQAMFFARFGTDPLPLMYLAQAVTTLIAMFALTAVLDRLAHRLVYILSPALLVATLLVERAVVITDAGWIYPVLWVTVAFATLAQAIGLWGVAGSVVDTRQAKRLFPIFGAGGILGSVAGGLLTRPLAAALGAPNLLFIWAGALAVAGLLTRIVLGPVPPPLSGTRRHRSSALGDLRRGLGIVRRSRLLMAMAVSAVLFSVLFYSLFLPFASAAAARYPDAGQLAGFLGLVWAVVTGTAFVTSILLTNRLFVWFGVAAMVLVLPLLYTGAFAILILTTAFSAIVSLRIMTGVWLQGVASPAWETLVNIVPAERRDQTRAFLNGGPAQVGTAIAGVVALVGQDVLTAREFAAIGLVASLLTLVAALAIRRSYPDALVEAMRTGRPQVFDATTAWTPMPLELDAEGRRVLMASMRSDDLRMRRLAFQLAARGGSADPGAILRGVDDPDAAVRLATVRALDPSGDAAREALGRLMEDVDVDVAAAAAARSLNPSGPEALDRLHRLLRDGDPEVRRAALGGLALAPEEIAADLAAGLLGDPDPEVRAAALARIAGVPERALGPSVAAIADPDPAVRRAAGRTLGGCGPQAVQHVLNALADPGMMEPGIEAAPRLGAAGIALGSRGRRATPARCGARALSTGGARRSVGAHDDRARSRRDGGGDRPPRRRLRAGAGGARNAGGVLARSRGRSSAPGAVGTDPGPGWYRPVAPGRRGRHDPAMRGAGPDREQPAGARAGHGPATGPAVRGPGSERPRTGREDRGGARLRGRRDARRAGRARRRAAHRDRGDDPRRAAPRWIRARARAAHRR